MITPDAGSAGFPARLVAGRTTAASLRPGAIVKLRTALSSLTGRTEFVGKSLRLAPAVAVDIPPGKTVRLLVMATTPQLRLKLLPDAFPSTLATGQDSSAAARHVLSTLGLPYADGAEEVVRALINSHRDLSAELIRMLFGRIGMDLPSQRRRQRRARAMVELADRDLDLDAASAGAEELIPSLIDGRWLSGGRGDHQGSGDGSDDEPSTLLRSFLSRATSNPSHEIQLFNYLKSSSDLHWVVIPIGASKGEHATTGTLRVGVEPATNVPREATLAMGVGSGVWWFSWKIESGGARIVSYETEAGAPRIPESLLARISGRGHTNTNRYQNGDGFSGTSSEVNKLGVDEYG